MTTYVIRNGELVDKQTGEIQKTSKYLRNGAPMVMRDIPEYWSPRGTGLITSRSQRREDLKRGNAREVDPSEWKPDPEYAARKAELRRKKLEETQ